MDDAFYAHAEGDLPVIRVKNIGYEKSTSVRKPRSIDNHGSFCLHYILDGRGTLTTHGKTYRLEKGAVFYLFPHVEAIYGPDAQNPWQYAWINVSGENIFPFLAEIGLTPNNPVFIAADPDACEKLFSSCIVDCREKPYLSALFILNLYYSLHSLFFRQGIKHPSVLRTHGPVGEILQYIQDNFADPELNVNDVAAHFGYHRVSLARLLKNSTGQTFSEHLLNARITAAVALFQAGKRSVSTVAYAVGFRDPSYFSIQFKQMYGQSPREFLHKTPPPVK